MVLFLVEPASEALHSPVATFVLLLAIVLAVPPIFEKIKLPGISGADCSGSCLRRQGLGWLQSDSDVMKLFSDVGKIYLMFVAGLEIDMVLFQKRAVGRWALAF